MTGTPAGQTALVVRIPEAEPAVGLLREQLDPAAREGASAHVTVLFPFLPASGIDDGVLAALGEVIGRHRSFRAGFERCGRLPGLLYLAPEPDAPFRRLTDAIVERWPQTPPYGGKYDDVVPHLTVAQRQADVAVLEKAEADLGSRLPFTAQVSSVDLVAYDGTRWQHRMSFPLRP
ncbi:2'-5' RNA ligase family protein [Streptomyces sp. NPDC005474]|uniref:2'-5' RNA ligase family protein n=1 Tax=Streptomyces sp. NPDC005474 TaxID=3154878 RepID=UPI003456DC86